MDSTHRPLGKLRPQHRTAIEALELRRLLAITFPGPPIQPPSLVEGDAASFSIPFHDDQPIGLGTHTGQVRWGDAGDLWLPAQIVRIGSHDGIVEGYHQYRDQPAAGGNGQYTVTVKVLGVGGEEGAYPPYGQPVANAAPTVYAVSFTGTRTSGPVFVYDEGAAVVVDVGWQDEGPDDGLNVPELLTVNWGDGPDDAPREDYRDSPGEPFAVNLVKSGYAPGAYQFSAQADDQQPGGVSATRYEPVEVRRIYSIDGYARTADGRRVTVTSIGSTTPAPTLATYRIYWDSENPGNYTDVPAGPWAGHPAQVNVTSPDYNLPVSNVVSIRVVNLDEQVIHVAPEIQVGIVGDLPAVPQVFRVAIDDRPQNHVHTAPMSVGVDWRGAVVPPDITNLSYTIDRSLTGTGDWVALPNGTFQATAGNAYTYTDSLNSPAGRVYYRVRATDGSAVSPEDPESIVVARLGATKAVTAFATVVAGASPSITLHWDRDLQTERVSIFRKARGANIWQPLNPAPLTSADPPTFVDDGSGLLLRPQVGEAFEYRIDRVQRQFKGGAAVTVTTYLYAGIEKSLTENRGTMILVVEQSVAAPLAEKLIRLKRDLVGDGWRVRVIDNIAASDTDSNAVRVVKQRIQDIYDELNGNVSAIFLIGHVPVPYSGGFGHAADGHPNHRGAWATDLYYGDLSVTSLSRVAPWHDFDPVGVTIADTERPENTNAPLDGKFDHGLLPRALTVPVGRIDLRNIDSFKNSRDEVELLSDYLDKHHRFRIGLVEPTRAALVDHQVSVGGIEADLFFDSYSFASLLPPGNTSDGAFRNTLSASSLKNQPYLFASAGYNGAYDQVLDLLHTLDLSDATQREIHAVFVGMHGSYFGDFNSFRPYGVGEGFDRNGNNVMRAMLANRGETLTVVYEADTGTTRAVGRPWRYHTMALGDTIGEATLLTLNDLGEYGATQAADIANNLLGDPTLRMDVVKPVVHLTEEVDMTNGNRTLRWEAPSESELVEYRVYRATSLDAAFAHVGTVAHVNGTTSYSFPDAPPSGQQVYMVRAVKLESRQSGTYFNASTGAFPLVLLKGTSGSDALYVTRHVGTGTDTENSFRVWLNETGTGSPDYRFDGRAIEALALDGLGGGDLVTITDNADVFLRGDQEFASLTISAGASATAEVGGETVIVVTDTLAIASGSPISTLDLRDNDLVVREGANVDRDEVVALVASGRNSGAWDGGGITSASARDIASHATTLGVLAGAEYIAANGTTFSGVTVAPNDVLVKYTWYGDTDLNGPVDFDDYVRTDNGYNGQLTGWFNGDFDYTGLIDFDDYVLIDLGFNSQTGTLRGDGGDRWAEIAQMEHFSTRYMNYLIEAMALRGVYLTYEDFFPDGSGRGDAGGDGSK